MDGWMDGWMEYGCKFLLRYVTSADTVLIIGNI